MKTILFVSLLTIISVTYSLKWEGDNANGHPVTRTFRILESPALGNPYTFRVLAVQRAVNTKTHKTVFTDAIEFTFSVVGLPHFVVRYFAKSTNTTIESSAIRHGLRKLVEYRPGNASESAGFVPGEGEIVQEKYFWSGPGSVWSELMISNMTTSAGANVYQICSSNDIGVTVCFYAADVWNQLTVNGSRFDIDPNAIHHTLDISNFPWKDTDTNLALKVQYEATSRVIALNDSDLVGPNEEALDLSNEGTSTTTARPVAAWSTNVTVTGAGCDSVAPVVRSVIFFNDTIYDPDVGVAIALALWSGEVNLNLVLRIVYFSFLTDCNQPTDIFWDPDMGYVDEASVASNAYLIFPSAFLALLAIFGSF